MNQNVALTQETWADPDDEKYEEEWKVILNTGGNYTLSKMQARVVQQAISEGNRGVILFRTFSISIPYIAEFYRERRYLKDAKQLPAKATEPEYVPIPPERWEEIKKQAYKNIGKPMPKGGEKK